MPFFYTDRGARRLRQPFEKESPTSSDETHEGLILRQVPPCEIGTIEFH